MDSNEIRIDGLADFYKQLQTLPAKIEGNVMRGALRAGQKEFMDEAKRLVPKDSGDLEKSIRIRFRAKSQKYGWVRMNLVAGDAKAWYAHIIEFGSGSYYEGKGTKSKRKPYEIRPKGAKSLFFAGIMRDLTVHPGVKPAAFMRQAFDGRQQQAIEATAKYIRTRLPKELTKAGK